VIDDSAKEKMIRLLGAGNFSDTREDRTCYAYDATRRRSLPDAVVFPETVECISGLLGVANEFGIPVVPRGAGSGFTGGSIPVEGGIVLVMNHFNRILGIDTDNLQATVESGIVTWELHQAVESVGLFYPPDPASMKHCTIGGNIAENAGGMRAVKYGVTKDYVMGLEVVLPTGEIIRTGSRCVKDVVGYNLTQLFVGSEGTLGIVTKAILKLLPLPDTQTTLTAAFLTMDAAAKTVSGIIRSRIIPTTIEFMDRHSIGAVEQHLRLGLPLHAGALLLIEVDGEKNQVENSIVRVKEACAANGAIEIKIASDKAERDQLWRARRAITVSLLRLRPRKVNEDIVVPRSKIPDIIDRIERIGKKHGLIIVNFGHAGDGNIHVNVLFRDDPEEEKRSEMAVDDIFRETISLGGLISGEHGIGITKKKYMSWCLEEPVLALMRSMKKMLDPNNILNPGKIFP
jgi:glycolate oxidase